MSRADEIAEALAELGRRAVVWEIATAHARCENCGNRVGRSMADLMLAEQLQIWQSLLKSKRFESEAPTMPQGRKKPKV